MPRFLIKASQSMWFKNLTLYRITQWEETKESIAEKLTRRALQSCTGLDMQSIGWVSPKPEEASLAYQLGTQLLISLGIEKKLLPATVINQFTKARAAEIEEEQGYKPGRKEMKEIKEAMVDELLPRAFAIRSKVNAWIDPVDGWMVIDAANLSKADELVTQLVKTLDSFSVSLIKTKLSPSVAMTTWLSANEAPPSFSIDQDCELRGKGESGSTVRYVRHALELDEIGKHLKAGKEVTKMAMTWNDKISFVMHDNLQLKRIVPLDLIKDQADANTDDDSFDTDFAIMTGELTKLIPAVIDALGGEAKGLR